ncbi:hypothetical protein J7T55_015380 [Diaporthe amygdali]|uniref:uncharacterized protein n=1 Tax=Phomopsis amygdali TaxID=1214568 RepID=UPI0022FDCCE3|nr:uncharacterized protein J7T55_015380 [Diaporthe amygdali]KAJ0120649.1 hypothetical protein J7T55_015380 [Diaporthe amygdali]
MIINRGPGSQASGNDQTRHFLSTSQRHGNFSGRSADGAASFKNLPPSAVINPHRPGNQGAPNGLSIHREELIRLFWEQDVPLRIVQDIMRQKHGLDVSIKVYKTQFRKWGIRKNLKGHEALKIATGQDSSPVFWPDDRDDELRGPDTLEKIEAATYYFKIYILGNRIMRSWFETGPSFGEQEAFSSLFIRGLERLSRNEQQQQAFKDINLSFDSLKKLVILDHPLVYLRLMASIAAFSQYPESEVCSTIFRSLSEYLRKLFLIIQGPYHPLSHAWGEALYISSSEGAESYVLGVAATAVRRYMPHELRIGMGALNIAECVPSSARGLNEASLRNGLRNMAMRPDLLPKAQETRLALAELMLAQGRLVEGIHFFAEARAFQAADPVRCVDKTFWTAELEWRAGNAFGSISTLKSALAHADFETADKTGDGVTRRLKEIEDVLRHRQNLLASESGHYVKAPCQMKWW